MSQRAIRLSKRNRRTERFDAASAADALRKQQIAKYVVFNLNGWLEKEVGVVLGLEMCGIAAGDAWLENRDYRCSLIQ